AVARPSAPRRVRAPAGVAIASQRADGGVRVDSRAGSEAVEPARSISVTAPGSVTARLLARIGRSRERERCHGLDQGGLAFVAPLSRSNSTSRPQSSHTRRRTAVFSRKGFL